MLAVSGCGCDAVGYPAVRVTVRNAVTGSPVPLAGAEISQEGGTQPSQSSRRPANDSSSTFTICCTPGLWHIHIRQAGYAAFDTAVYVRSEGRCDRPVLKQIVARLQPLR
jgi:hypothetical protein